MESITKTKKKLKQFLNKNTQRVSSLRYAEMLKDAGFKLEHIGGGCFRDAYRLHDTNWLIKIPQYGGCRFHSRHEMDVINKLKTNKTLKGFLPKVHYFNEKSCIMIMEYYENTESSGYDPNGEQAGYIWNLLRAIEKLFKIAGDVRLGDLGGDNIMFTKDGFKIIDLGLA